MTPEPLGLAADGASVQLDLDKLIGSHLAILANSGGGKSYTTRKVLEITAGRIQQIVIDPDDEYYTLRERGDYLLLGGDNGDAPLTVEMAGSLALTLLEHGISAILQINSMSLYQQQAFVGAFVQSLVDAPKTLWHPALVVIDEAHRFAPLQETTAASEAVMNLSSQGRKRGFTMVLATQRLAKVDRNVTDSVNNWLLGRVGQTADRKVAADHLGFALSSKESLDMRVFDEGFFYGYGPAISRTPLKFKVGEAATTHMKSGQAPAPTPPAPKALAQIVAGLAKAAKATDQPPNPPAAAGAPPGVDLEAIRREAFDAGKTEGYERGKEHGWTLGFCRASEVIQNALDEELSGERVNPETGEITPYQPAKAYEAGGILIGPGGLGAGEVIAEVTLGTPGRVIQGTKSVEPAQIITEAGTFTITAAYQKILDAVAWWAKLHGRPDASVPKKTLGFLVGMSPTAGGFANYLGKMRGVGLISYPVPNEVALTPMGQTAANAPSAITPKQVQDMAMDRLPPGRLREILEIILEAYPASMTKKALADRIGMQASAGGFANYVSRLKSLDMITYPAASEVRASDLLFPGR